MVGVVFIALVAITTQASAHVTAGNPTLSVIDLEYRVPVEPAPTTPEELAAHHNDRLVVSYPAGFKVEGCQETDDFACEFTVDEVSWTRREGSTNFEVVDSFSVSVRTPGIAGTYLTPALQVYSDGEERLWKDPNSTDPTPAPQVRVNGPDRAPAVATGVFKPLSELGAGTPCPQEVIDEAIRLGIDPAVHCGHFGFEPPAETPEPPPGTPEPPPGTPEPPPGTPEPPPGTPEPPPGTPEPPPGTPEPPPGTPEPPPPPEEPELDVRGTAQLVRTESQTSVEVVVTGLEPGLTYMAHLHEGTCTNPTSAHYKDDPAGPEAPPNELWPSSDPADPTAGLTADETGTARGSAVADWVARPTARAIWIHEPPVDPSDPHAHARIACADLV